MEYRYLRVEKEGAIAIVFISREENLNALNTELLTELQMIMEELDTDEKISVIILTGSGDRAFVAGGDIGEMSRLDPLSGRDFGRLGQSTLSLIEHIGTPVIAAINGYALGGGLEIAMACDIRIASDSAVLGQPEVGLGVIPGFGGTQRLSRLIGVGKAKELIFTGKRISGQEAREIGLVEIVVPREKVLDTARDLASQIAKNSPLAVKVAKSCIDKGAYLDIHSGLTIENEAFALMFSTHDQKDGMKAFLEKRAPKFKGK